jgi:spermidine synthase
VTDRLPSFRLAALFLLSITLIAYELAVMRTFAVGSWSNFGAMVISIALLGNGLAGTLLTFHSRRIRENPDRWLSISAVLLGPAMAGAHVAAQHVPFNPVMLAADWTQLDWIGAYYLIYGVPFFIGAVFVGAIFVGMQERVHQLYFWNMVGSGLGGFVVLGLMYILPPAQLVAPLVVLAAGVSLLCFVRLDPGGRLDLPLGRMAIAAGAMFVSLGLVAFHGSIEVSDFKPISYARHFPDARVVYHTYGPTGEYYAYQSSYFHFAPGLSDNASLNVKEMPRDAFLGLYIDGDGPIGVMRDLKPAEEQYIDYLPMSAPYLLLPRPNVLLLRLGGAIGVYNALYHDARSVWVAEPDATLVHMLRDVPFFRAYDDDRLRDPRVHVVHAEPRAFAARTARRFDLVEIGLIDSVGLSQTGGYPLVQNYIYTVEGIDSYLSCLTDDGILSITVWNRLSPPRNVPELLTTVTAALEKRGVKDPGSHVFVFDYLLSTATILVKNSPFTEADIATLRGFLEKTSFQASYYEGMPAPKKDFGAILDAYTNEFRTPSAGSASVDSAGAAAPSGAPGDSAAADTPAPVAPQGKAEAAATTSPRALQATADTQAEKGLFAGVHRGAGAAGGAQDLVPEDLYYFTMKWLLTGRARELYQRYFFNIRPATDDRPYYTGYVKPSNLMTVLRNMRSLSEEWGYVLEVGTFVLSILFGFLIILVPLVGRWRELFKRQRGTARVIVYYGALGVGYMLVEIYLIQRLVFFLADPIFSNSVVITAMLMLSGIGALVAGRYRGSRTRLMAYATAGIAVAMLFYMLGMPPLLDRLLGLPLLAKMGLSVLFVAPGAFFLGMPFPTGLSSLSSSRSGLIPWAWGMNGALSVTGTALALLVSISWGFSVVLLAVIGLYALAFLVFSGNVAEGSA